MTIIHRSPGKATLSHGQLVMADLMPLKGAMAFGDIPSSAVIPGTTHVITIRYREDVSKGDVIEYGGERWDVLSAFDPYARADYNPRAVKSGADMRRKFLKVMVRRGQGQT